MSALADPFPRTVPHSPHYRVRLNGEVAPVLACPAGAFASFTHAGDPVEVEVEVAPTLAVGSDPAIIRPRRLAIAVATEGHTFRFTLPTAGQVFLDFGNRAHPLYLFGHPPVEAPDPANPKVHFFRGGQIHEIGQLELKSGETAWLDAGAVVRGAFTADDVEDVTIAGPGVLDGSYFAGEPRGIRPVYIRDGRNIRVHGPTLINAHAWHIHFNHCRRVAVERVQTIGQGGGSDGIDIVSSRDVVVRHCFLRCGDDCIAIKAHNYAERGGPGRDVDNILVEHSSMLNDGGGNCLEIGHELRTDHVGNIAFRDLDLIHKHGHGAAFSINNAGWATVRDVLFADIRVEHYYCFLLSLQVMASRYSATDRRGQVENITFRNIDVTETIYNAGYSVSLIGGYDTDHRVRGVHFENFRLDGVALTDDIPLSLHTRHADDITFTVTT